MEAEPARTICGTPARHLRLSGRPDERREAFGSYLPQMAPLVLAWSLFPDEYASARRGCFDSQPPSPLCHECTRDVVQYVYHTLTPASPPGSTPDVKDAHLRDCTMRFLPGGVATFGEPSYREFLEGECNVLSVACGLSIPSHFYYPLPRFLLPRFSAVVSGSLQLFSLASKIPSPRQRYYLGGLFRADPEEMALVDSPSARLLKPWLAGECTSLLEDWRRNPRARSSTLKDLELLRSGKLDE